jgi:hypothetical protein
MLKLPFHLTFFMKIHNLLNGKWRIQKLNNKWCFNIFSKVHISAIEMLQSLLCNQKFHQLLNEQIPFESRTNACSVIRSFTSSYFLFSWTCHIFPASLFYDCSVHLLSCFCLSYRGMQVQLHPYLVILPTYSS